MKINRLTPEQLAQIRERAENATEGPWDDFDDDWDGNVYQYDRLTESAVEIIAECSDNANRLNDANFIAHAREDIPNLLAEIEALQADNAQLRTKVRKARQLDEDFESTYDFIYGGDNE